MSSRNSFLALFLLTQFYLFSQAKATPAICEETALESAVDCGCFLYRPLYESDPIWDDLEDLCEEELSGNIQAGNSSCESAPFEVPSLPFHGVATASIQSASEYFKAVRSSCRAFEEADRKFKNAERRIKRLHKRLERAKENGTAHDVVSAEYDNEVARHHRKVAGSKRKFDNHRAKQQRTFERHQAGAESQREEWERKVAEVQKKQEEALQRQRNEFEIRHHTSSTSFTSSTSSSTSTTASGHGLSAEGRTTTVSSYSSSPLATESRFKMSPTVRFDWKDVHPDMVDFCFILTYLKKKSNKQIIRTCCPEQFFT